MGQREIKGLRGLKGFNSLSQSEYNRWKRDNAKYLSKYSTYDQEERLYNTQRFAKHYGKDTARKFTYDQRLAIEKQDLEQYNNSIMMKNYNDLWNPLRADGTVDPNKGMGNFETFYKYGFMEPQHIGELIRSSWLTDPELNSKINEEKKKNTDYYAKSGASGTEIGAGGAFSYFRWGRDADERVSRGSNQNIIDGIYAKDMAFKANKVSSMVNETQQAILNEKSETQIKQDFIDMINSKEGGIPQLAAFYDKNGNIKSSEVKSLGKEEMAGWLAKNLVYTTQYAPITAADMLDKEAKDYINEHQDWMEYSQALGNSIAIGASSYAASMINGTRGLFLAVDNEKVPVWKDRDGNFWGKEYVKDGVYTDPYTGEKIPVTLTTATKSALDMQGIAPDGTTRDLFFNNKYWSDAEATETWTREEQARAKELNGYSPTKVVYKAGEDKDYLFDVAKMAQFAAADAIISGIPVGGTVKAVGTGMSYLGQILPAVRGISQVANGLKTAGASVVKAAPIIHRSTFGTLSAVGLGHSYGMGKFYETLENNRLQVENNLYNKAEEGFHNLYNSDSDEGVKFKNQVDNEINNIVLEELSKYGDQIDYLSEEDKADLINSIKQQAYRTVSQDYTYSNVEAMKNTPEYSDMIDKSVEEATNAALATSLTIGAKYVLVNNFGHRRFLFKGPRRLNSSNRRALNGISSNRDGRLSFTGRLLEGTKKTKWGEVGKIATSQFVNGALTNFTDELQSAGAARISEDRMARYLNDDYEAAAENELLGKMSILGGALSYMAGAGDALSKETTWEAGLVGGLGSITSIAPNAQSIMKLATSRKARRQWREASAGEKANMLFTNGILSNYYDRVLSEKQVKATVDQVNAILDKHEDFRVLGRGLALDMAEMDATDSNDKDAIEYVKAVRIAHDLSEFSNSEESDMFLEVAQRSPVFQTALETVDKIINNKFTEEDAKEYLTEYYARNPSEMKSEENHAAALETIKSNAQKLKTGIEVYNAVNEAIDRATKNGKEISPLVKARLVDRFALDQFLDGRIADIEEGISGSRKPTVGTVIESFGNDRALGSRISDLNRVDKRVSRTIEIAKADKAKADKKVNDYIESKKDPEDGEYLLTSDEEKELTRLQAEADAAGMQLRALEEQKRKISVERHTLVELKKSKQERRVLSSEEILRLSPEDRARMLDDMNFNDYSEAQQIEITKAKEELNLRNPKLLNDVQYQASMVQRKDANRSAYSMMMENPEAAAAQLDAQVAHNHYKHSELIDRRNSEIMEDFIKSLEESPKSNRKEIEDTLFNQLIGIGNRAGIETLISIKNYKSKRAQKYSHVFDNAIQRLRLHYDVRSVINRLPGIDDAQRKNLTESVSRMINELDSSGASQDLLNELGTAIESDSVTQTDKDLLSRLLNSLEESWDQQSATTTYTREERQKFIEQRERAAAEEAQRRKDAEEAARAKAEDEETAKKKSEELAVTKARIENIRKNRRINGTDKQIFKPHSFDYKAEEILEGSSSNWGDIADIIRTVNGIDYVTGERYLRYLQEPILMAIEAGVISPKYLKYIDKTRRRSIEKEDLQEIIDEFEKLGINSPKDLKDYIEKNASKETDTDASNDRAAELGAHNLTDKDMVTDNESSLTPEQVRQGIDEGATVSLESPTIEEQATITSDKVIDIIPSPKNDNTNQGNDFQVHNNEILLGNRVFGYDVNALKFGGKQVKREGSFFEWMDTFGVKLQDIIDNELNDISKLNPNLYPLRVKIDNNATKDDSIQDLTFWVVEYTPEVASIHDESLGGVVTANGKQYLMVGTMGFDRNIEGNNRLYLDEHTAAKVKALSYFRNNPSERFFVDTSRHTQIQELTAGWRVRQLTTDPEVKIRTISELLADETRNPKKLTIEDLKWGIQYGDKFVTVNVSDRNVIYPPSDSGSNVGSVFLLIESANGNYIPAYINPIRLSEIKDGKLKDQIEDLFNELTSTDYNKRLAAVSKLRHNINISKEGDWILIGQPDKATVSIQRDGKIIRTFNLEGSNFDRGALIEALYELNPRINVTTSVLSSESSIEMYDEAGALTTDLAKIGTSNASYNVYAIDANGNPIITAPIENQAPSLEAGSDLAKAERKKNSESKDNIIYRKDKDGNWLTNTDNLVTDPVLIEQLNYKNLIRTRGLKPDKVVGKDELFIVNNDKNNPLVLVRKNGNYIFALSKEAAIKNINLINAEVTEQARQERLQEEFDRESSNDRALETISEEEKRRNIEEGARVDLNTEETITDDMIVDQIRGDFTTEPTPQQKTVDELIERVHSDTADIHLTEDGTAYEDSEGKRYARVTSVIAADEFSGERFSKDNPWGLPSTTIGTGIDEFIRDFFDNKLGNMENLADRYPNASNEQLQAFARQLEGLRKEFERRGLTIVPRDVTVTGTVEVKTDGNDKTVLDVAGTLDLLAYDKDGGFYIFDMKTNRSVPRGKYGKEKGAKWSKQLTLYKQLLQEKYGIAVKGMEIIPIQVDYPAPKGYGNATTEYSEREGQLYANGEEFRMAEPILHDNIPLPETTLHINYSKLTPAEQAMVRTLKDMAPTKSESKVDNKAEKERREAEEKLIRVENALSKPDVVLWSSNPVDNVAVTVTSQGYTGVKSGRLKSTAKDLRTVLNAKIGDSIIGVKVKYKDRTGVTYVEFENSSDGEVKSAIVFPISGRGGDNFTVNLYKTLTPVERDTIISSVKERGTNKVSELESYLNTLLKHLDTDIITAAPYLTNPSKLEELRRQAYKEVVPIVQSEPVKTGEDINKTGTKSLIELQHEKSLDTALSIIRSAKFGKRVRTLLKEKFPDMPSKISELERFLQSKKINTTAISDVEDWIRMIEECK